ncbi:MAG: terminase family protein [Saprospiraceae bacterium]|nr:hypothetical protein [Saprospiraceae bacterium]
MNSTTQYEVIIQPSINPLPDQEKVFSSLSKLNNVPSTRRSGKTSGIIYNNCIYGLQGQHIANVYPTHDDCKEIYLKIELALNPFIKQNGRDKSAFIMRLITGGSIRFFSYEAFARVRGKKFHKVYCDEFQECRMSEKEFFAALLPTLADFRGRAWFFGTPKKGTLIHSFSEKIDPEWSQFKMTAVNNPFINPEEITLQKKLLDPLVFAQEWEGEFVDFSGEAWLYDFKRDIHLVKGIGIDEYSPLMLCFDFNVDPCTCLVKQKITDKLENGGGINFIKEITNVGGTTQLCHKVRNYLDSLKFFKGAVWVTGDSSGSKNDTRSNSTDYEIIRKELSIPFARFVDTRKQNPNLSYSRDLVNTAFYNNIIYIDSENCPILARDCSIAKPKEGSDNLIKDRSLNKLDSFDAMRYGIHADFKSIKEVLRFAEQLI